MEYDKTTHLDEALIQYGKMNDRIYLMKLGTADPVAVVKRLDKLAADEKLGKIFVKIPASAKAAFVDNGYQSEGRIPGFYNGAEDAEFLGKFLGEKRQYLLNSDELEHVLELARSKADDERKPPETDDKFSFNHCRDRDADEVSGVYREVFPTYPFPIHNPEYILKTMHENILYFSIRYQGKIVSLSSSEMDLEKLNVEMTDFATLPDWRGNSLASFLLERMEHEMKKLGMKTAYTIARAVSPGINITFARAGYAFGGTLINNTNISGRIESMNVWHKTL